MSKQLFGKCVEAFGVAASTAFGKICGETVAKNFVCVLKASTEDVTVSGTGLAYDGAKHTECEEAIHGPGVSTMGSCDSTPFNDC